MNLEHLIKLIFESPNNIDIRYSNINGQETLLVNGKEVQSKFNDSEIKSEIAGYKQLIEDVDDCMFVAVTEEMSEHVNLKEFNDLLEQQTFTESEAETVHQNIEFSKSIIHEHITNKIKELEELLDRF